MLRDVLPRLLWLGHGSFVYEGPPVIYFDPYEVRRVKPADLILVGHDHLHHCSLVDIDKVRRAHTVVVADRHAAAKIEPPVIALAPGEQTTAAGVTVEAVPAYNLQPALHPRRKGHLGFIVTVAGVRLYHAGDTDFIPEMRDLRVDIALLPVSGMQVMNAQEAAQAALALRPQVAIPMHYGLIDGSLADAEAFRTLLAGKVRVEILGKS